MLKDLLELLIMAVIIGFFVGAMLFAMAISAVFIFYAGIPISFVGGAFLLFLCCWLVGSVLALFVMLTGSFGFGR